MNKFLYLLVVVLVFGCGQGTGKSNTETTAEETAANLVETTINIGGMHCDMCVASIEKGVNELAGVQSVAVSLTDSLAVVAYDGAQLNEAAIEQAIEKRGYTIKK